MTSLVFDRPVGAAADLAELEYISALHQTSPELRADGSIDAADVSLFLKSRYGIEISEADVCDVIFANGLSCGGGSVHRQKLASSAAGDGNNIDKDGVNNSSKNLNSETSSNDGKRHLSQREKRELALVKSNKIAAPTDAANAGGSDFLDLTEVVAALLIPELIRAANSDTGGESSDLNPLGKERPPSDFQSDADYNSYLKRRRHLEEGVQSPPNIIGKVLEEMIDATFGVNASDNVDGEAEQPFIEVNEENIKAIFRTLGDRVLADNDVLVGKMVEVAKPDRNDLDPEMGPVRLDAKAFARALVSDVSQYRLDDDISPHTVFRDVFGCDKIDPGCFGTCILGCRKSAPATLASVDPDVELKEDKEEMGVDINTNKESVTLAVAGGVEVTDDDATKPETPPHNEVKAVNPSSSYIHVDDPSVDAGGGAPPNTSLDKAKPVFAAPSIDYTADTYANQTIAIGLWVFLLLYILASGTLDLQDFPSFVPTDVESCPPEPNVPCDILRTFLTWVDRIFTLVAIGGIVIMCMGAMGNNVGNKSRLVVLLSMIPAAYFFIKPFTSIGTGTSQLKGSPHLQFALGTSMFVAAILLCEKFRQLLYLSFSNKLLHKNAVIRKMLSWRLTGSEVERKQAASHKMNRLMANAFVIAQETDFIDETSRSTQASRSLTHFFEKKGENERAGGYLWTFRSIRSRDLYRKEGVLLSGRLLAANIMQYAIIIYIILYSIVTVRNAQENYQNNTIIILVDSVEAVATSMLNRLASMPALVEEVAQKSIDLVYSKVLPAIEAFQLNSCDALFAKASYTDLLAMCAGSASALDFDLDEDAVATLCSSPNSLQALQTFCTKSTGFYSNMIEEAKSFKVLVELAVTTNLDGFQAFVKSFVDSGFEMVADTVAIVDPIPQSIVSLAFGIGGLVAFFMAICLATLYVPSVTSTVLRFRSGVLPSLRDPMFSSRYRGSTHFVTYLTGAMFWGSLVYCAGIIFIVAVCVLVLYWFFAVVPQLLGEDTRIWGRIIGSILAFLVQYMIFTLCAKALSTVAYYRKRPAASNIYTTLWEASWIGTSIFFVAIRAVKLIVAAGLQVGRIDVPFMADGVGQIGSLNLDRFPLVFRTDILQHEAHRHPYIERIGKMYLMKIRHGNAFANSAGSSWRTIFVLTLMPWLRQYRYMARYGDDWKAEIKMANRLNGGDGDDEKNTGSKKTSTTMRSVAADFFQKSLKIKQKK